MALDGLSRVEFCQEKLKNICDACPGNSNAAATLALYTDRLLEKTGDPGSNQEAVLNLTQELLGKVTREDITRATSALEQLTEHFLPARLDDMINSLELSYHCATHAHEMKSDIGFIYKDLSNGKLASLLGFFHDHVQIRDDQGMGVGNAKHWGLNEIMTASALATLAKEIGIDDASVESLLLVAGAVIPSGTAFGWMVDAFGPGQPGMCTLIEKEMLAGNFSNLNDAGSALAVMALTLAICDTQRNNLQGIARFTDAEIFKAAPGVYSLLMKCAEEAPQEFGKIFADNGKLNEAGLALCSKLASTIAVFKEFPPSTPAGPNFQPLKINNPLSKIFNSEHLSKSETYRKIIDVIASNGGFGSRNIADHVAPILKSVNDPVLKKMSELTLLEKPETGFVMGYKTFAQALDSACNGSLRKLEGFLTEMADMNGPVKSSTNAAR